MSSLAGQSRSFAAFFRQLRLLLQPSRSETSVRQGAELRQTSRCPWMESGEVPKTAALPGPPNWPLLGSLMEILWKGGLKRQHYTLVSVPRTPHHLRLCRCIKSLVGPDVPLELGGKRDTS